MFVNQGTILGIFPLPDPQNELVRVVGNIGKHQNKDKFTDSEIKNFASEYSQGACEVAEIVWSSPFWIHSKMAAKLRNGSVFIAGDAAHVHSPAGGQGMNIGLQDAFNLSWKLAMVIQGKADARILDTYQQERLPIIKNVLKFTETLGFLGLSTNRLLFRIRNFIFKNITNKVRALQKRAVGMVTQVALSYRDSSLVEYDTKGRKGAPKPGQRIPDVVLANGSRLYDYLRNSQFNLLFFTGDSPTNQTVKAVTTQYNHVLSSMGELVKPHIVSSQKIDVPNFIDDSDSAISKRYNVKKPCMCLVRPDQYIALFVDEMDASAVKAFLNKAGFTNDKRH